MQILSLPASNDCVIIHQKPNSLMRSIALLLTSAIFWILPIDLTAAGGVRVGGYTRKDGTYVESYHRSAPDRNFYNNWSTKGNVNPYTGKAGTKVTPPPGYGGTYAPRFDSTFRPALEPLQPLEQPVNSETSSALSPRLPPASDNQPQNPEAQPTFAEKNPQDSGSDSMGARPENIERAKYWKERGYNFNPNFLTASMMDREAADMERAKYWKERGFNFDPKRMTALKMDEVAEKRKGNGHKPNKLSASNTDRKAENIERAKYWKEIGLDFDPNRMTASEMDEKAEKVLQALQKALR
jgi:hypothetical protein